MKSTVLYYIRQSAGILTLMIVLTSLIASCKKDSNVVGGVPVINSVTTITSRNTNLTKTLLGSWIYVKGQNLSDIQKLTIGSVEVPVSTFYSNDTSVTVKIPDELPNQSENPIYVENKFGNATYNFTIVPPAPVITSAPTVGSVGESVSITGLYMNSVTAVKFGNANAEIVSQSKNELIVKVPAGDNYGFITLIATGGTTLSSSAFGFKATIYDDIWNASYKSAISVWNPLTTYSDVSTEKVKRGTYSVKVSYTASWQGWLFSKSPAVSLAGFSAIKLSVWAPTEANGKTINLSVNGVTGTYKVLTLGGNKWNDFTIKLSDLGSPATFSQLALQNTANNALTIYLDDIGFL